MSKSNPTLEERRIALAKRLRARGFDDIAANVDGTEAVIPTPIVPPLEAKHDEPAWKTVERRRKAAAPKLPKPESPTSESAEQFAQAAQTPERALARFPVYEPHEDDYRKPGNAPHWKNCPTCSDGGFVVPYTGDGRGNVTVLFCINCNTRFKREDIPASVLSRKVEA